MENGYKIINLKSPTVYEDIKANYRKPLLFTNIEIGGIEKNPIFAEVLESGNDYVFYAYEREVRINQDNLVQYNSYSKIPTIYNNIINIKFSAEQNITLNIVSAATIVFDWQILEGYKYLATGNLNGKIPLYAEVVTENENKVLKTMCADGNVYTNSLSLGEFTFFNTPVNA